MRHRPHEDDDEELEIVRATVPTGADALAQVIAQSNREAHANRAQARELIKALESVQKSQEYLGTALREERTKSRWLVVVLLIAPVVAGLAVWHVSTRVDDAQSSMESKIDLLSRETATARAEDAAKFHDERLSQLATDLEGLHRDLDASRDALAAERRHLADREAALNAAMTRTDAVKTEIGAYEFEVKSAKAKAGAEQARSAQLENRIKDLETELKRAKTVPVAPVPAPVVATPAPQQPAPAGSAGAAAASPPPPAAKPPAQDVPAPLTPEQRAEAEKARLALNVLLAESPDGVRYQFDAITSLAEKTLSSVRLVGRDQAGTVLRTIVADKAEITVDAATGSVVIRFTGGKLVVGLIEAPFFGGTYGLVVRGDADRWKRSGFTAAQ